MWVDNSNPFHATQPPQNQPTNSDFKKMNLGRKIKTKGKVSISFEPHNQELTDRLTVHTSDKTRIIGVKMACIDAGNAAEDLGIININDGETMTVGWNCKMDHSELRIPRLTSGLVGG